MATIEGEERRLAELDRALLTRSAATFEAELAEREADILAEVHDLAARLAPLVAEAADIVATVASLRTTASARPPGLRLREAAASRCTGAVSSVRWSSPPPWPAAACSTSGRTPWPAADHDLAGSVKAALIHGRQGRGEAPFRWAPDIRPALPASPSPTPVLVVYWSPSLPQGLHHLREGGRQRRRNPGVEGHRTSEKVAEVGPGDAALGRRWACVGPGGARWVHTTGGGQAMNSGTHQYRTMAPGETFGRQPAPPAPEPRGVEPWWFVLSAAVLVAGIAGAGLYLTGVIGHRSAPMAAGDRAACTRLSRVSEGLLSGDASALAFAVPAEFQAMELLADDAMLKSAFHDINVVGESSMTAEQAKAATTPMGLQAAERCMALAGHPLSQVQHNAAWAKVPAAPVGAVRSAPPVPTTISRIPAVTTPMPTTTTARALTAPITYSSPAQDRDASALRAELVRLHSAGAVTGDDMNVAHVDWEDALASSAGPTGARCTRS